MFAAAKAFKCGRVALILSLVSGCAGQEAARHAAAVSAESVNGLKREMMTFVEQANNLRTANELRLQRLDHQALALRVDAGQASSAWQVSKDQRALEMYNAMTAVSAENVSKASLVLDLLRPQPNPPKITFSASQFDRLVQHLNEVATEPGFSDSLSALIDYGIKVSEKLKEDVEKAENGLAQLPAEADSKTKLLTNQ